jgi:hypothetical protein
MVRKHIKIEVYWLHSNSNKWRVKSTKNRGILHTELQKMNIYPNEKIKEKVSSRNFQ